MTNKATGKRRVVTSGDEELTLSLWTTRDIGTHEFADRFLATLRSVGTHWVPNRFGPHEPLRCKMETDGTDQFRALWTTAKNPEYPIVYVLFRTDRVIGVRGTVHWARGWNHDFNTLTLAVPLRRYRRFSEEFWRVTLGLFTVLNATYGSVRTDSEFQAQHRNPAAGDSIVGVKLGSHIPGVYYGNLFGQEIVNFLGEDRLRTCPAVRNERLLGGRWLLIMADEPSASNSEAARSTKEAVRRHLGEQAFFDIRIPDRPTIHPFFDFSAVRVGSPGAAAESSPVSKEFFDNPSSAQQFIAEVLVRSQRLITRVRPSAVDYSPASLRELEASFKGIVASSAKQELVLDVAAYFGEVLRRSLGGAWRLDNLSGMPVICCDDGRVEYPVLRALKFLEDGDLLSDWYEFVARGGERLLSFDGRD